MSRTIKGKKGAGYDYWSRRPHSGKGYGPDIKDASHRSERMKAKEETRKDLEDIEHAQQTQLYN